MNKKFFLMIMLLTLFVFMNNVSAAELPEGVVIANSCSKNLMKSANWEVISFKSLPLSNFTLVPRAEINTAYNNAENYVSEVLIPVEPNKTICFSQQEDKYSQSLSLKFYDSNYDAINYNKNIYPRKVPGQSQCTSTLENSVYLVLYVTSPSNMDSIRTTNLQIEYDSVTEYVSYEECAVEEPEPTPSEPLEGMQVITNFYNVFLNNLTNFIKFASGNFAILSCLTTIVLFITVDLFFKIFRR